MRKKVRCCTIRLLVNGTTLDGVELIIFDKDGTLTDLYAYWSRIAALRAGIARERLGLPEASERGIMEAMGLDIANARFRPEGPIGMKKRGDVLAAAVGYLEANGVAEGAREACEFAFSEADKRTIAELPSMIRVIPGVREFFGRIQGNCRTAIATADNRERAQLSVKLMELGNVDLIVGSDEVKKAKPDPEIVLTVLERLGVSPEHAVMIGDSRYDLECSANAKLLAGIGVATGILPRLELEKSSRLVVDNLSEICVEA